MKMANLKMEDIIQMAENAAAGNGNTLEEIMVHMEKEA